MILDKISQAIEKNRDEIIEFVRQLIQTPSLTGQEKEIATVLKKKMEQENFTQVKIDSIGNVIGTIKGIGKGKTILYNGHMDHVPPGNMPEPYSAKILKGTKFGVKGQVIYGRGGCDMKGALGSMVMAGTILKNLDIPLQGDLIITGTVHEEELALFPSILLEEEKLQPDAAVVGECTNLDLAYGNRGVVRNEIITYGKSCHASVQERGVNALYQMTKVLNQIQKQNKELPIHPNLGQASWSICKLTVSPNIVNVVPDQCVAEIDTRTIPDFSLQKIVQAQQEIINKLSHNDPKFKAKISVKEKLVKTWTGLKTNVQPGAPPFYIDPNHWFTQKTKEIIQSIMKKEINLKIWGFTTESCCFSGKGIPTIGFGPGEERFTHSENEALSIEQLLLATEVYATLAYNICNLKK